MTAQTTTPVNIGVKPSPAYQFVLSILEADISPYMLGVLDAERGELCVPEAYFIRRGQMCEYAEGYEAVAGRTLTTDWFLGPRTTVSPAEIEATLDAVFAPVVDDSQLELDLFDYEAELADYQEDMLDREYHASGAW